MKLKLLRRRHAECDEETWQKYDDLCKGGAQLRKRINKYIPKHDVEPQKAYKLRLDLAYYLNYAGPIVQFFSSMLFSAPPIIESEPETIDEVYEDLKEDCDGNGTDLVAFAQAVFEEAMVKQKGYARVVQPQQPSKDELDRMSLKDYEEQGLDQLRFVQVHPESLINWRKDDRGRFIWVLEYEKREELLDIGDEELTVTETWTWWSDDSAKRWQLQYKKSEKQHGDKEVPQVAAPSHFGRIPIIDLTLPDTLWLMNFIADAQLEHFRSSCALSYSQYRAAFPMLFFFLKDVKKPPVMGAGYYGMLGAEEDARYVGPDGKTDASMEARVGALKDEIHRVATQMARGVDNNAAAVGRSGESKKADSTATEVVLLAMAKYVCEFLEKLLDLVAAARNDDVQFNVNNPATFDLADAQTLIENAVAAMPLGIQSPEHNIQVQTSISMAMNAHADETAKKKIRDQITKGFSPESIKLMQQSALKIPFPKPGEQPPAAGQQQPAPKPAEK